MVAVLASDLDALYTLYTMVTEDDEGYIISKYLLQVHSEVIDDPVVRLHVVPSSPEQMAHYIDYLGEEDAEVPRLFEAFEGLSFLFLKYLLEFSDNL